MKAKMISIFVFLLFLCGLTKVEAIPNKQTFDMSNVSWDYSEPFVADGEYKTVVLKNLPTGLEAIYINNRQKVAGFYTASVNFVYNESLYNAPVFEDLDWSIYKKSITTTDVYVSSSDGLPANLDISLVPSANKYKVKKSKVKGVFNISLKQDGEVYEDNGVYHIRLLIPTAIRECEKLGLYHSVGSSLEELEFERDGNYFLFDTSSFSDFVIVEKDSFPSLLVIWIFLALIIIDFIILGIGRWRRESLKRRRYKGMASWRIERALERDND